MSVQEKNLRRWLDSNVHASRKAGLFQKVQVRHVQRGNKVGDEICFYEVPGDVSDSWTEDTTREILENLGGEANNLGGVQKFACYAFFSKSDEPVNRHIVRMASENPENEDDGRSLDSESTDAQGLVSQSMRHTEVMARLATSASQAQTKSLITQLERYSGMVETFMQDKLDNIKLVNELLDRRMEREIELNAAKTKQKAVEAGIESAKLLGPVIVNKLLKKKILTEPDNVLAKLMKQFFGSIAADEKKLASIINILDRNQQIALMELIEQAEVDAEDKKSEKKDENGKSATEIS